MKVVIKKMFYKIYKQELESVTEINLKLKNKVNYNNTNFNNKLILNENFH